mmetsp:Transcript_5057/g.13493  ORF Transcript_5057/g.13493 Transcript_5057/m.13493 type:complete len:296 (-) Transcript_5057:9-896(-)
MRMQFTHDCNHAPKRLKLPQRFSIYWAFSSSFVESPARASAASSAALPPSSPGLSSPASSFSISACASSKCFLNVRAISESANRRAKTVSESSPSAKSKADHTQDRSDPTLGSSLIRGSRAWLAITFMVFSCRISNRSRWCSLCRKILASPIPRSFHDLFPVPTSSKVSPKMNNFERMPYTTSSSSSPDFTSTSSSLTTGSNWAVDSSSFGSSLPPAGFSVAAGFGSSSVDMVVWLCVCMCGGGVRIGRCSEVVGWVFAKFVVGDLLRFLCLMLCCPCWLLLQSCCCCCCCWRRR